jgi:hypothetical protein
MLRPGKVVDMKCLLSPILRLVAGLITLLGTRGIRAVLAENFLLKRQLLVLRRSRRRAPNLCAADRWLFGFYSQFLNPRRLIRAALILNPATLLRFHRGLKDLKYQGLVAVLRVRTESVSAVDCGRPREIGQRQLGLSEAARNVPTQLGISQRNLKAFD